jgi:hypothetical protein
MRRRICWYLSILLSFIITRHIYHLTTHTTHPTCRLSLCTYPLLPSFPRERTRPERHRQLSPSLLQSSPRVLHYLWSSFVVYLSFLIALPVNLPLSPFLYHQPFCEPVLFYLFTALDTVVNYSPTYQYNAVNPTLNSVLIFHNTNEAVGCLFRKTTCTLHTPRGSCAVTNRKRKTNDHHKVLFPSTVSRISIPCNKPCHQRP